MKKGIKFSLYILGISMGLVAAGCGLVYILKCCGLMFRAWVKIAFFVIMVLLGLALTGGIIYILAKVFLLPQKEKRKRTIQKVLAAGGIVVTLIGTVVLGFIVLFVSAFAYKPEHVIEKHGQKMVAYVESFLDVGVTYHEYKNFLVCGYDEIGYEWYGDGGYDPFTGDPVPEPKNYKFYDTQGNIIAQSERQWGSAQDTDDIDITEKESDDSAFPPEKMKCTFNEADTRAFCEMSYSTDGEKWKETDTGYHYQFFFGNTGYLVFSYNWAMQHEAAAIYKSANGGKNWIFVSDTPSDQLLQNTVFFDENTGIFEYGAAGTDSYLLYVTKDGADTMRKVDLPAELQGQEDKIKEYIRGLN